MRQINTIERDSSVIFVDQISKKVVSYIEIFKNIDMIQFVGILFIAYSFNSYFGLPMFDSQPFPFLMAVLFLSLRLGESKVKFKTPLLFFALGILAFSGIFFGAFFSFEFNMLFIRGIINYSSIFILMVAFYEYIKTYGFPIEVIIFVNLLWIIVGIIQLFDPYIVSQFVARRTSISRGVTSLGPEPSSFGMHMFFVSWIYLMVVNYKPNIKLLILIFINIASIFFLAISAMTIVFMLVTFIFYLLYNWKQIFVFRNFLILAIIVGVVSFIIFSVLEGSRMQTLFSALLSQNFFTLLQTESSVSSRVAHQVVPIYLFLSNMGLPAGLQSFVEMFSTIENSTIVTLFGSHMEDKIMSWNATMFFELGLLGVMIWILLYTFLMNGTFWRFGEITLLFILLFSSVPPSYPLIPMIFVILFMTNLRHTRLKEKLKRANNG